MSDGTVPAYHHTQKGPWALVLGAVGASSIVVSLLIWEAQVTPILTVAGVAMLVVAASFRQLTVADEGDSLLIAFGRLPLFSKRIRYADIQSVEVGRTLLLDGVGIHYSVRGGWVWNIWGRQCVVIHHTATTWLGTDDAENLARFLQTKLTPATGQVA